MKQFFTRTLLLTAALLAAIAPARAVSNVANISTRMVVETGDNVLISGFIINGAVAKNVMVRALGPSLPVPGALADPILELHDGSGRTIATNDNWRSAQQEAITASGLAPSRDEESAIIASLSPGSYTAIIRGVNNATGVGLVEVYDLDGAAPAARLANISARGHVLTNDNVMIGGFIIRGDAPKKIFVRVDGPTLSLNGSPIADRLQDPTLELYDQTGALVLENDNWRTSQQPEIAASTLAPSDDREPALIAVLAPGNYTAIVRGKNNTTGVALIEIYDLDQPVQADGSTLYLAQLRPLAGVVTGGSGTSTLRMAADAKSAVVHFEFSNLSSAVTGIAIYSVGSGGQLGQLLFDVSASFAQPDGSYNWIFAPRGTFSVDEIVAAIQSGQVAFVIQTSANPAGELSGTYSLSTGGAAAPTPTPPPPLATGTPSPTDAARFLAQATFGPTDATIAQVQNQGFDAFLTQQFAAPMSSQVAFVDATGVNPLTILQTTDAWWTYAVTAPDQLRQRVAFALSELMVVGNTTGNLGNQPGALPTYMDVLAHGAFGNFRQLLEDVTLNPAMGRYLNMLKNDKANASQGTLPNENYAREVMQLFSIGLYDLNLDASLTLSSNGLPIPTYNQDAILGTAAVFTGWTYYQTGTPIFNPTPDWRHPMVNVASHHSTDAKQILDGVTLPAGQSAAQDLKKTLDTIFNHPNVGPFVCRQLIQRLVTSNPSPGYVYRVASVFNDNGHGVRGDLQAVVRAILLDYDARGSVATAQGAGKEREPVLRLTNLLRAFGATSPDGKIQVRGAYAALGQEVFRSPTVFNFFPPDYAAPGPIAAAGLRSPEFAITTETTVITIANFVRSAIYGSLGPTGNKITLNLANEQTLAANPAQLVDHLNQLLLASSMSPATRATLLNAINQIPSSNSLERVRTAIYLVVNSPEFVIER